MKTNPIMRFFASAIPTIFGILLIIGVCLDYAPFVSGPYKETVHHITQTLFTTCVGFMCVIFGLERRFEFRKIEKTFESMQETSVMMQNSMQDLSRQNAVNAEKMEQIVKSVEGIQHAIEPLGEIPDKVTANQKLLTRINNQTDIVKNLTELRNTHCNPVFGVIFKDYIDNLLHTTTECVNGNRITFTEHDIFEKAYDLSLERFRGKTIFATSSAEGQYFWTQQGQPNNNIEDSIEAFIKVHNGRMVRIFFMEPGDFDNMDIIRVLNKQVQLGVEVFTIAKDAVCADNYKYFVYVENENICWRLFTNEYKQIVRYGYSANKRDVDRYAGIFQTIKRNKLLKVYLPINSPESLN